MAQGRYVVEFLRFNDGKWYVKTTTENPGAAGSVACSNYGRIGRVTDTETGNVRIYDVSVDWERYEANGVDVSVVYGE